MKRDPTLEQIAELMDELSAYQHRTVVIKIGGNSIAEDEHFLAKIAKQVKFLNANGVRIVIVHGGGPQIDDALRDGKIPTAKGPDGRRITSPEAMGIVHKVMNEMNLQVVKALTDAECAGNKIICAARHPRLFVQAEPIDPGNAANRSGKPKSVAHQELVKLLEQGDIVVLHSIGGENDSKAVFNLNSDDYAMAIATAIKAKRLILVTNVSGVLDKNRERIRAIDQRMADDLIKSGVVSGGMVPKVESALWVVKEGVGGVAIVDGFAPWAILAELLTYEGFGTLVQANVG